MDTQGDSWYRQPEQPPPGEGVVPPPGQAFPQQQPQFIPIAPGPVGGLHASSEYRLTDCMFVDGCAIAAGFQRHSRSPPSKCCFDV